MKLYYVPMSRAGRPRWLLEELGVPYELVRLDVAAGANRQPEYLAINPLGHVPTLVDGKTVIYESLAICLYLADKYPERELAPPASSPARGPYLQWAVFSMVTLEQAVEQYYEHTVHLPNAERVALRATAARRHFDEAARVITAALGGREYLVGDHFTVADLMVGSVLAWGRSLGLLAEHSALEVYGKRLATRPAARRARAD